MKNTAALALLLLALGVALGAFGAHGLRDYFTGREEDVWKTAVFYHLLHAIGLLCLVALAQQAVISEAIYSLSSQMILAGILFFSGSLYLLVLTRIKWLGAITPIGGVLLIASWMLLAWSTFRRT